MALQTLDIHWTPSLNESFDEPFVIQIEEGNSSYTIDYLDCAKSSLRPTDNIPQPPPPPPIVKNHPNTNRGFSNLCYIPKETKEMWDRLFKEGCGVDVHVIAEDGSVIAAHQNVLTVASPVLGSFLQQSEVINDVRYIKIPGVPYGAVYSFIRFLYSSCYEEEEMNKYILHLLVLSHSYIVPYLKRFCEHFLEKSWLTKENVIDVLQLARKCDTPRLAMICMRMVFKDFRCISSTEGWKVMKRADPLLEQELLESLVEVDSRKQDRVKKIEEKRVYLQLHEAMEALLHICRDGCRTIGPRDKVLKENQVSCNFPACKGLETLIRHFSGCKTRVPGGCIHCKRMWQLLELHSRMCNEPDSCKIPLCRHFKGKMQRQSKKEAAKWKLLVSRVIAVKNTQKLLSGRRSGF